MIKPTIEPPDVGKVVALLELANTEYPEFGTFLQLAVITGARRGELCALKWERIDWARETLAISQSIAEVKGGIVEKGTKTHAVRRIALDTQTLAVLDTHRKRSAALAEQAGCELTTDSYVFSCAPGAAVPWTPSYASKTFQRLRGSVGLASARFHDLRHFAATRLLSAGMPVRTVSGRLGHANAATTLGVYAHFTEASDRVTADAIARLIPPDSKPLR